MAVVESTNELKQLPLFALLAYAARCARRVYPLFRLNAGNPEARLCQQAIYVEAAENFAGPTPDGDVLCQADSSEHGLKARIGAKRIVGRVDLHAANG